MALTAEPVLGYEARVVRKRSSDILIESPVRMLCPFSEATYLGSHVLPRTLSIGSGETARKHMLLAYSFPMTRLIFYESARCLKTNSICVYFDWEFIL